MVFSINNRNPLEAWFEEGCVQSIHWSFTKPSVFFVHRERSIDAWNLLDSLVEPICSFKTSVNINRCVISPVVPKLAIACSDGSIMFLYLSNDWIELTIDEHALLSEMIQQ